MRHSSLTPSRGSLRLLPGPVMVVAAGTVMAFGSAVACSSPRLRPSHHYVGSDGVTNVAAGSTVYAWCEDCGGDPSAHPSGLTVHLVGNQVEITGTSIGLYVLCLPTPKTDNDCIRVRVVASSDADADAVASEAAGAQFDVDAQNAKSPGK